MKFCVEFIDECSGTNVRQAIEDKREASQEPVQPYLICLVPDASISKMFAVVDNKTVEINSSSFVKGLDILFKIYHVFNVNYPTGWSRFLSFLEWGFYKIDHRKLTNTMKDLITRIEG
ncbi:Phosphoglycerate kinase [Frankliniella fusca]|uniref:Phosphoglycerate kinase n=1 Tax=Frankliniella fusca TaxID=407009 RepID=A0AAE1I4X5_9NEOP|nr:Phosphoglycerate kinase [Frankliniella fusca]